MSTTLLDRDPKLSVSLIHPCSNWKKMTPAHLWIQNPSMAWVVFKWLCPYKQGLKAATPSAVWPQEITQHLWSLVCKSTGRPNKISAPFHPNAWCFLDRVSENHLIQRALLSWPAYSIRDSIMLKPYWTWSTFVGWVGELISYRAVYWPWQDHCSLPHGSASAQWKNWIPQGHNDSYKKKSI